MNRWKIITAFLLAFGSMIPAQLTARSAVLSPSLEQAIATTSSTDAQVPVVVFLENERSHTAVGMIARDESYSRAQRIVEVTRRLKATRATSADAVEQFLNQHSTTKITKRWIVAAYGATLSVSAIEELAEMPGVSEISINAPIEGIEPVDVRSSVSSAASVSTALQQLNVPALWQAGLTGKGRLVCSFDTGVDEVHPALSPKWRGNHASLSSAWYSPITPDTIPFDKSGHGSHTMGIMVGSVDADSFGVAPGAEWITAGVIDQGRSLSVTVDDILGAFEWALDPDGNPATTDDVPDVILNSWGIPKGVFAPCDETFYAAIDNVEAAGIATIFAAGNEGPNAMTIRNPGDRATTPINALAVGAVDGGNVIASFSGRGPSSCDTTQIKPELVAPGVSIRSCAKNGAYATMSGTSMAAPYIAGLVALCRQYNPDATVEQIKHALLQATTDLGPVGEDNAYGNGIVDASKLLAYLPAPVVPQFSVTAVTFDGCGYAQPGQPANFHLSLQDSQAGVSTVLGRLTAGNPSVVSIEQSVSLMSFVGEEGMSDDVYRLTFSADLAHGQKEPFRLTIESLDGTELQAVEFEITVGLVPNGGLAMHNAGDISFTVSDFGQYGFAPGSIYNLGGDGFRYNGGANMLYEAGLVISRGSDLLSNSVRDSVGGLRKSDFTPLVTLTTAEDAAMSGVHQYARFSDRSSAELSGLVISQQTVDYAKSEDQGIIMVQYYLINTTDQNLEPVSFGFMADFDLSAAGDSVGYDAAKNLFYQSGDESAWAGIVGLQNVASFKTISNGSSKIGLSRTALAEMIASPVSSIASTVERSDVGVLVSTGPLTIASGDSVAITLALVAAGGREELSQRAARARTIFTTSGVADLPEEYFLSQNYPNPFNPQTTIQYSLPTAGEVQLEVFNLLGQRVKTIAEGYHAAGTYTVMWDGTDSGNSAVASGVYFYRLVAPGISEARKMVLLH